MGLTKPIEQNKISYQGTFMYLKNIIRGGYTMKLLLYILFFPIILPIKIIIGFLKLLGLIDVTEDIFK